MIYMIGVRDMKNVGQGTNGSSGHLNRNQKEMGRASSAYAG